MVTAQIDKSKAFASAEADIYASELWSGSTDVTQLDGTKIHAEVTFVQKVESGSATMLHFTVQSGTVHVTPPPMSTAGCPQTLDPVIHDIGPNDGSLSVTYTLATGPEDATVVGAGTTAWAGTYTEMCSNGTQTVQSTIQAPWWPVDLPQPDRRNDRPKRRARRSDRQSVGERPRSPRSAVTILPSENSRLNRVGQASTLLPRAEEVPTEPGPKTFPQRPRAGGRRIHIHSPGARRPLGRQRQTTQAAQPAPVAQAAPWLEGGSLGA